MLGIRNRDARNSCQRENLARKGKKMSINNACSRVPRGTKIQKCIFWNGRRRFSASLLLKFQHLSRRIRIKYSKVNGVANSSRILHWSLLKFDAPREIADHVQFSYFKNTRFPLSRVVPSIFNIKLLHLLIIYVASFTVNSWIVMEF